MADDKDKDAVDKALRGAYRELSSAIFAANRLGDDKFCECHDLVSTALSAMLPNMPGVPVSAVLSIPCKSEEQKKRLLALGEAVSLLLLAKGWAGKWRGDDEFVQAITRDFIDRVNKILFEA